MTVDKQKLQKLLWNEVASWKADCCEWKQSSEALGEFLGEKTVEEVALELLTENERLKTLRSTTERDLAQELEVWRHGPSCWNCGDTGDVHDIIGEWRGQCDCNAAKLIDVAAERDQLKAENEALIAAAQALRDEWRKDQADAERYRWLRVKQTFIWLIQDWFPKNNVLTDVDAEIDAAMGKGEQS